MRLFQNILPTFLIISLILSGCGEEAPLPEDPFHYNEILAAQSPYAIAKFDTPVLSTHEWDRVFGGDDGVSLAYDRFGELDELEFIAPKGTPFILKRQIRKKTRNGETIYFQVSVENYQSQEDLWVDGRFLDVQEERPPEWEPDLPSLDEILKKLRSFKGIHYTWNGNHSAGIPELLDYYQPAGPISERLREDWKLSGLDSLGALFEATSGATPLQEENITDFGESIFPALSSEGKTIPELAEQLMAELRPLDLLTIGEHTWIVLDQNEVLQSRYRSNFDGDVSITPLLHTVVGLLEKRTFVAEFSDELPDPKAQKFVVRRWFKEPEPDIEADDTLAPQAPLSTEDVLDMRTTP